LQDFPTQKLDRLLRNGGAQAVLDAAQAALATHPDDPDPWRYKMRALNQLKQPQAALDVFAQACAACPRAADDGQISALKLQLHMALHDPDAARAELDRLTSLLGTKANPVLNARYALARTGPETDALIRDLQKVQQRRDLPPVLTERLSELLFRQDRSDAALEVLKQAQSRSPLPNRLVLAYGKALLRTNQAEAAITVLSADPDGYATTPVYFLTLGKALAKLSRTQQALQVLEDGRARYPDNGTIARTYWPLLVQDRQRAAARAACLAFAETHPADSATLTAAANFLQSIGEAADSQAVMDMALKADSGNSETWALAIRNALMNRDNDLAMSIFDAIPAAIRPQPRFVMIRARMMRWLGQIPAAITHLEAAQDTGGLADQGLLELAELQAMLGRFDSALGLLDTIEADTPRLRVALARLRAEIALQQGHLAEARDHVLTAIALEPDVSVHHAMLSQLQCMAGDWSTAWETHLHSVQLRHAQSLSPLARNKPVSSIRGHLLNEARLLVNPDDITPLWDAETVTGQTLQQLKTAVDLADHSTPAAYGLTCALRRLGHIRETPPAHAPGPARIPAHVIQFWDTPEPPADIQTLIAHNARTSPDFDFRLYTKATARQYMMDKEEHTALRAFQLAPHAAGQADVFRLVVLWHEGGVYLDADDYITAPLSEHLDRTLGLIAYQENIWSVGNNFLAVAPHHPVIRAALDDAAQAFLGPRGETLWLASGPGAITRALTRHGTNPDGTLPQDTWVMPLHRLTRFITPHVRLSYKATDQHWSRAAFDGTDLAPRPDSEPASPARSAPKPAPSSATSPSERDEPARKPPLSFFVIGAARSGSTSIFRALTAHPDVFEPKIKEPRFFNLNWSKGWDWYADIYADAPKGAVCGDFSPSYSNAAGGNRAARRIRRFYPDARLLYMIRNPIECAISNWRMTAELSDDTFSFRDTLNPDTAWATPVLHRSMFFKQISEYRVVFPDEQILVAPLELLRREPDILLPRIQSHLRLDPAHPLVQFPHVNTSDSKPDRPATPDIPDDARAHFLELITEDAHAMLDYLDQPHDLWDLTMTSPAWTQGLA